MHQKRDEEIKGLDSTKNGPCLGLGWLSVAEREERFFYGMETFVTVFKW